MGGPNTGMLSIHTLRQDPDAIQQALRLRRVTDLDDALDRAFSLDTDRRAAIQQVEELRAARNQAGKAIGRAKEKEERERLINAQRAQAGEIDDLEARVRDLDTELLTVLAGFPNLVDQDTPEGDGAAGNVEIKRAGEPRAFAFEPQPHWELGQSLGVIDTDLAASMSGARMMLLRGAGARLQRALIGYFLDHHIDRGYTEIYCPVMVREEAMFAAGKLPKFGDTMFHDAEDDYWFIPTAEVPLTVMHRDAILDTADLPIKYVAHTPCFRREKVSAGRDVRGIKRLYQFEKVEMYQFTRPEDSGGVLEEMLAQAEELLQALGLTYRVLQLCSADLGFTATKAYDLEVWAPGAAEWLEVSTVSTCTDFQARRANIRYRPEGKSGTEFVHTLNGSGLALPRVIAALLETYQEEDGSVLLPEMLHHRLGFERMDAGG